MARLDQEPVLANPADARDALDTDIPKVLRGIPFERSGWQRPDPLTLLVPMWGMREGQAPDLYLLRLHFGYYPEWPPSTQFVNPLTGAYDSATDARWLPRIEGNNRIQVHQSYADSHRPGVTLQLICASVTLEFYAVRHGGQERDVWSREHHNFAATLNEIRSGLGQPWYRGRMG